MKKVKNRLQVWHHPQIPCKPFCVDVPDEQTAKIVKDALANQHLFLYENKMIPDYNNSVEVVMWDHEWTDYWNKGMNWDEFEQAYLTK